MRISVLTPVYNRADCIERCLRSVASQSIPEGVEVEHVVVDDGSTDGTRDLLRRHEGDRSLKIEYLDRNRGTNAARNAAARVASGEFVLFLDSDDELMPGVIDRLAAAVRKYPEYRHYMFVCDDRMEDMAALPEVKRYTFEDFLLERVTGDFVHLFPRETMLRYPFDENLRIYESIFMLRFYKEYGEMLFVNEVLSHRERDRSDRVTVLFHLVSDVALHRKIVSIQKNISFFDEDYRASDAGKTALLSLLKELYRLHVLDGNYAEASSVRRTMLDLGGLEPSGVYRTLCSMRIGSLVWMLARYGVRLKYRFVRT